MDGYIYKILFRNDCFLTNNFVFLQKSYNVLFNNISTYADPAFLDMNITIASNKQAFDMHIMVKSEMQPYNLTVEILMSPTSENRYNTLIKRSLPFCEFAKGKYGDPIIKMLYEEIKMRGAQFIEKCPAPVVRRTFCKCKAKHATFRLTILGCLQY